MSGKINLNADMGEGFGAYNIGDDAAILEHVASANVACGFHAGDPNVMHRVVTAAKQRGVSIGAHPGFNDLWGFGRRRIETEPSDVEYMVAYQIGALQALTAYAGTNVTHLKPHGALYNMAAKDYELAHAIGRAIRTVDERIIYVVLAGSEMERAGIDLGLRVAREGFIDRQYEDDGKLTPRKIAGSVIVDPTFARERISRLFEEGGIVSRNGKWLEMRFDTLCVHGDEPTGVIVARTAREQLEALGVEVVPLPELELR